ncbi:hypothetical protein QO034_05660 [Sedimentitalea sp. JM2-8]|uniref:Uncharacterized protein n=1 Tax=Sedimentitalea xiamensis TaxID=3050037 RepID=A0ABT7FBW0_9RHOB|nr:hypothetical protein [Sedimentitalea xiamensis]MDK3072589.1 hypothetical protein [Sedimentitalea xiamensis]
MQFIDQSPAYAVKSMSLDKAIGSGRARTSVAPGGARALSCFRPELKAATAFDREINDRLDFNALPTPEKLDLLIDDLLPRFFQADKLAQSGRDRWLVSFLIDGRYERNLLIDAGGVHRVTDPDMPADISLETDIMTLMAILRSVIADVHLKKLDPGKL